MHSVSFRWVGLLLWLWTLGLAKCEAWSQEILAAPAGGIRDDSRVFNDESRRQMASELLNFEQQTGIKVLVESVTFIDGGVSAAERAKLLARAWLPQQMGLVVCHNRSASGVPEIVFSHALEDRLSAMELGKVRDAATKVMTGVTDARERLILGLRTLMTSLVKLVPSSDNGAHQLLEREDLVLAGAFGLFILAGATVGAWLARRSHTDEAQAVTQIYLPEVEVAQRFGAPCGGGVMASIEMRQ